MTTMKSSSLAEKYRSQLKLNEEARYNHDECGDTKERLYVRRTRQGYLFHCHNCAPKFSGFHRASDLPSPSETLRLVQEQSKQEPKPVTEKGLPSDMISELPQSAWLWLDKYDITNEEKEFYGFGYTPRYNRLAMPITSRDGLVGWQGRALGDTKPKYMTFINGTPKRFWFDSRHGIKSHRDWKSSRKIILVEDIISAIKVGREVRAIALLGSYVREELVVWMKEVQKALPDKQFSLWLDPDKYAESLRIVQRLRSMGINISVISTQTDPKDCEADQIRMIVNHYPKKEDDK